MNEEKIFAMIKINGELLFQEVETPEAAFILIGLWRQRAEKVFPNKDWDKEGQVIKGEFIHAKN